MLDRPLQFADRVLMALRALRPVLTLRVLSGDARRHRLHVAKRVVHTLQRRLHRWRLIEADARRAFLHALGKCKRRQGMRDTIEQRQPRVILGAFQLLPVDDDLGRPVHRDVAEDMRVAMDHLGARTTQKDDLLKAASESTAALAKHPNVYVKLSRSAASGSSSSRAAITSATLCRVESSS